MFVEETALCKNELDPNTAVVPLMMAAGSGAASRSTMGTGVVFGMGIATVVGLFLIPICYVFVQGFTDRKQKPAAETAGCLLSGFRPEGD